MVSPEKAFNKINQSFVGLFKNCGNVEERYALLGEILPENVGWEPEKLELLILRLHRELGIDFGVCGHYAIENGKRFCHLGPEKVECLCHPPQRYCKVRDMNKDPRSELERPELQTF
ncbi:MAG: hypothetical protein WC468_00800 [Candidatus Paceibacterota bacterium]